ACQYGIVEMNFGQPWNRAHYDVFDAGLFRGGDRDRVSVATETGCNPENVNFGNGGLERGGWLGRLRRHKASFGFAIRGRGAGPFVTQKAILPSCHALHLSQHSVVVS